MPFRSKFSLCFGEPLLINNYLNTSIKEFNEILNAEMKKAEKVALNKVGR